LFVDGNRLLDERHTSKDDPSKVVGSDIFTLPTSVFLEKKIGRPGDGIKVSHFELQKWQQEKISARYDSFLPFLTSFNHCGCDGSFLSRCAPYMTHYGCDQSRPKREMKKAENVF
tara:strand:+ start:3699 stop:4043 length:345 start_codon:yes stop_codon:yes gene_type:complete